MLAACRKPADLAEMARLGFEPVELDLDCPQSVARAAEQVLVLTDNRPVFLACSIMPVLVCLAAGHRQP